MVFTSTFLQDSVKFIRNNLDDNLTDPISASRSGRERFVMTSYPKRNVKYPIITVKNNGPADVQRLGMRSNMHWITVPIEIG